MPSPDNASVTLSPPPGTELHYHIDRKWEQPPLLLVKAIEDPGPQARKLIGENGVERFERFLRAEEGWNLGQGSRLSRVSVALLKIFSERYADLILSLPEPSLYLHGDGYLMLEWDLRGGGELAIDFPVKGNRDSIELYLERPDHEIVETTFHLHDKSIRDTLEQARD